MKSQLGIFDQSTASGKTFKLLIKGTFDTFFAVASKVLPYVKTFLLQVAIHALELYIALKPSIQQLKKLFSGKPNPTAISWTRSLADAMMAAGPMIVMVVRGLVGLIRTVSQLANIGADAAEAGKKFVLGLADSISSGADIVVKAVSGLASSAVNAFLPGVGGGGSHTAPAHATGGLVGRPAPGEAFASVAPGEAILPAGLVSALRSAPQVSAGADRSSRVYNITIPISGSKDDKATARAVAAELANLFDSIALTQGA
jgi:hypothetical protein